MDGPLRRPAGLLGSPPTSGSQPAGSDALTSGKPLAFSIDRIMARTPEPRSIPGPVPVPSWFQSAPAGKPDACPSSLHCMIPLVPLGYEPGHRLSLAALDPGHFDAATLAAPADFLGFGLSHKSAHQDPASCPVAAGQYKLFRPRVVNQSSSFPTVGTVCYLNCGGGDVGACAPGPPGLVNLHPMASYLLSARHKAFMAEKSKPGPGPAGDRYPGSGAQAFKELAQSQIQIQNYMKERDQILTDKIFKGSAAAAAAARLSGACPGSKPKVFTCEVCGKVSPPGPGPETGSAADRSPFSFSPSGDFLFIILKLYLVFLPDGFRNFFSGNNFFLHLKKKVDKYLFFGSLNHKIKQSDFNSTKSLKHIQKLS